jgi:aspartate carbamoyltransferase regulatory subunit
MATKEKQNAVESMMDVVHHVHEEVVAHCEYCGKLLSRSEVNDYGSLCESCYMEEYY